MGEVVSLTIQWSAAGATAGAPDAAGRGGDGGAMSRRRSPARTQKPCRSWRSSLILRRLARLAFQPVLRRREAGQAGDRRAEIDRLPVGVEARRLELVDPGKEGGGEAGEAPAAVGAGWAAVG